ncbi:hypothetical protein K504DRAFT_373337 [Pleomassaria siparia CBS 279.74]|uniref:ATP-dependent protease-like protein n=1 Tax=Pleomassaria siparia CBS 279.74 TaxID=1314801 RepID=A0A6G1KIM6_9PLEO|nr:hypothetical protein K504DRAFT_373337 [Pleomassaria siparia CBS 279.74]
MVDDEPSIRFASAAHRQPRLLVRLLQCPQCSKPFNAPVHLPCGDTVCRACLPSARPRTHVSYPNTPDRLQSIVCPLPACGAEHAAAECCLDVTMNKLMELIELEMSKYRLPIGDTPTRLIEKLAQEDSTKVGEKEMEPELGHERVLHGGRLLATFTMAQMGELRYNSEVEYSSVQSSNLQLDEQQYEYESLDIAFLVQLQEAAGEVTNCLVCYNMMLDPTTTACGHTFCRRCLTRVMDHSNICPLCRRDLHVPASLQNKPSNRRLSSLLDLLCPEILADRLAALKTEEQPGNETLDTPLFVCTLALPTMPTFLHVFEPRYRLMMRRCMDGNKRFGMVMYNRTGAPQGNLGPTHFLEYGTMLEIVNHELLRDGRSFVEARGVGRFKIQDHGMLDGYIVGRVEKVEDVSLSEEQDAEQGETSGSHEYATRFLAANPDIPLPFGVALDSMPTQELLDFCMRFVNDMRRASAPWLSQKIVQVYGEPPANDPALFPYWFACVLPINEEEKYRLLQTTRVRERLKIVKTWIERIQNQRR